MFGFKPVCLYISLSNLGYLKKINDKLNILFGYFVCRIKCFFVLEFVCMRFFIDSISADSFFAEFRKKTYLFPWSILSICSIKWVVYISTPLVFPPSKGRKSMAIIISVSGILIHVNMQDQWKVLGRLLCQVRRIGIFCYRLHLWKFQRLQLWIGHLLPGCRFQFHCLIL